MLAAVVEFTDVLVLTLAVLVPLPNVDGVGLAGFAENAHVNDENSKNCKISTKNDIDDYSK